MPNNLGCLHHIYNLPELLSVFPGPTAANTDSHGDMTTKPETQLQLDRNEFPVTEGELARLMRTHDWSQTSLGPVASWAQSLRTAVSLILNSQHPMWIGWGPEAVFLYNDAYIQVLSRAKHPWALGRP
ncbi:MAG TPA: hypothetical protein VMU28_01165, partial [Terriglobales bacterium]|nr:hypothetical protein [Terriglobales bacterium]